MTIQIFGGGTIQHVRNHFALCAPAYGGTARQLFALAGPDVARLHLTKMADHRSTMETNEDVAQRLQEVLADPATRAVVFNVALCDYSGQIGDIPSGKYATRLSSREGELALRLTPAAKLLQGVKVLRPDVRVVGFKTTADRPPSTQVELAQRQIREAGVDFVLANDTVTRLNLLVSADETSSGERPDLLARLIEQLKAPA